MFKNGILFDVLIIVLMKMKNFYLSLISCFFIFSAISSQTLTVNALDDKNDGNCDLNHCSLREAITLANSGGYSQIDLKPIAGKTIFLNSVLPDLQSPFLILEGNNVVLDGRDSIEFGLKITGGNITLNKLQISGFKEKGLWIKNAGDGIVIVKNCIISENLGAGIRIDSSSNIFLGQDGSGNMVEKNSHNGLEIYASDPVSIQAYSNIIEENGGHGIYAFQVPSGLFFSGNQIFANGKTGAYFENCQQGRLFFNAFQQNLSSGLHLSGSSDFTVSKNKFLHNASFGVYLESNSERNKITQSSSVDSIFSAVSPPFDICLSQNVAEGFARPFSEIEFYEGDQENCDSLAYLKTVVADENGYWTGAVPNKKVRFLSIAPDGSTSLFSICPQSGIKPIAEIQAPESFCDGEEIELLAQTNALDGIRYFWKDTTGIKDTTDRWSGIFPKGWVYLQVSLGSCKSSRDSILLNPLLVLTDTVKATICEGKKFEYLGNQYDRSQDVFFEDEGQCGKRVLLQIETISAPLGLRTFNICEGEQIEIEGLVFNANNRTGQVWVPATNGIGCDSLISVELDVQSVPVKEYSGVFCGDEEITIAGKVFNRNKPKGEIAFGCDSLIQVNYQVGGVGNGSLKGILCSGTQVVFNGTVYDEDNQEGIELLKGPLGCDSLVVVELDFLPNTFARLDTFLVGDEYLEFNGNRYDKNRKEGREIFRGQGEEGCHLILDISIRHREEETLPAFLPDAFSPNGDGINDVWEIFPDPAQVEEVLELKILDRWGGLVHDGTVKWDGIGKPEGIYLYKVVLLLKNGKKQSGAGTIVLIR
jgi:gliding motility-associated-like protein/CSLREA domain-containing protein